MSIIERRSVIDGADGWDWPEHLHPVVKQVLARRALGSLAELELRLESIVPVSRFNALGRAVELLLAHRGGRIVVVGDFDADGATSTALTVLGLRHLGFTGADFFIPDRFELGYGLSPGVIERLEANRPGLIVTVDNGISSVDGVAAAKAAGIDVLVTDHHLPPEVLPAADVIVNPNIKGDAFPGKHLAGVGVVFYLLAALGRALGEPRAVAKYLDLVALGTVADLVRLDHLNRILVEQGLKRIRAGRCRPGIRALAESAGCTVEEITTATLGFQLGPRLNAAGRLDDMSLGVRCLLSESDVEARKYASELDALNRTRRELEARMKAEAIDIVDELAPATEARLPAAICLKRDDWHEGLVGLVASRVKDRYHRPTFAFAPAGERTLKGSGRSVAGFHLRDALAELDASSPGLIERFGGHAMAAGLSIDAASFGPFETAINDVARRRLGADALTRRILTDGALTSADMTLEVAAQLREAAPWGQGFPEPCFDGDFELVESRVLKERHLKLRLRALDGGGLVEGIAFNRAEVDWRPGMRRRLAFRLDINDYFVPGKIQLVVEHIDDA